MELFTFPVWFRVQNRVVSPTRHPLDLIHGDLIAAPVIKAGCLRIGMRGHLLSVLQLRVCTGYV